MISQQEMRKNSSTLRSWRGPRWTTLGCVFGDPKGILRGNVMIAMTVQVVPWMSRPRHTLSPLNFCYPSRNVHLSRSPQAHSNMPKEIRRVREFQPKHFMLHQTFQALNNHIQRTIWKLKFQNNLKAHPWTHQYCSQSSQLLVILIIHNEVINHIVYFSLA